MLNTTVLSVVQHVIFATFPHTCIAPWHCYRWTWWDLKSRCRDFSARILELMELSGLGVPSYFDHRVVYIGVVRRVHWVHLHPRVEKNWGKQIYRGSCKFIPRQRSAPLKQRKRSIFEEIGEIWTVGEVIQLVSACVLRATTIKGRQLFWWRKVHPRQNPGYAYGSLYVYCYRSTESLKFKL